MHLKSGETTERERERGAKNEGKGNKDKVRNSDNLTRWLCQLSAVPFHLLLLLLLLLLSLSLSPLSLSILISLSFRQTLLSLIIISAIGHRTTKKRFFPFVGYMICNTHAVHRLSLLPECGEILYLWRTKKRKFEYFKTARACFLSANTSIRTASVCPKIAKHEKLTTHRRFFHKLEYSTCF